MNIKRKIYALLMIFTMIFTTVMPVYASDELSKLTISEVKVENMENGSDAEIKLEVKNNRNQAISANYVLGLYDNDSNKLIIYTYLSDILEANASRNWGGSIPIPEKGNYKIKAFAWDKMESPETLSNILEISGKKNVEKDIKLDDKISETAKYILKEIDSPEVGTIAGEWSVFSLARSGYDVPKLYYDNYYNKVLEKVNTEKVKTSYKWNNKVTDVERVIIALTSIGKDPTNVSGENLLNYIWNKKANFPNLKGNTELGGRQGSNELIFALLALDTNKYEMPDTANINRDQIIEKLLSEYEIHSGGFSLNKNGEVNIDLTAMAIQALAPYKDTNKKVEIAIDKSIDLLSRLQGSDGMFETTFGGQTSKSVETIAQVVVGLSANKINANTDSRFVKNDRSLIDALVTFYVSGGGFKHTLKGNVDPMSTDQGFYALVSYDRLLKSKNTLYDLSDVKSEEYVTLSIEKRVIGKNDIASEVTVKLKENDTALSLLKRYLGEKGIKSTYKYYESFDSTMLISIDGDYDSKSGWLYDVNRKSPNVGADKYKLEVGDDLRYRYTTNWGTDLKSTLVEVLKLKIIKLKELYSLSDYTKESYDAFSLILSNAEKIANDEKNNSRDKKTELLVSAEIGKILEAAKKLKLKIKEVVIADSVVPDDFENDIWLNKEFKIMRMSEIYKLNARRVPEIIDNPISNKISHPTYHYSLIKGDSVKVDDDGIIEAIKLGTSIIEVTYDSHSAYGKEFGAVSSVNKAYFVADVVNDIDTGIIIDTSIKQRSYDTIYYKDGDTVDYSFDVTADSSDEVVVTCNGNIAAKNGEHYVVKLENRNNIIKVSANNSKGTKNIYYIVEARKIEVEVTNLTNPSSPIEVGDNVKVKFKGITLPVYKLATIYNPVYTNSWGNEATHVRYNNDEFGMLKGKATQYDMATKNEILFTPTKAGEYKFTNGRVYSEWWGDKLGSEKDKVNPGEPNLNAPINKGDFSTMPDFSVDVNDANFVTLYIEKRTIGKGDIVSNAKVKLKEKDTAWSILKRYLDSNSIEIKFKEYKKYDSIYIQSIDGDGEFSYGSGSGWKYEVNGSFPSVGVSKYTLKNADIIRLKYCVDYGNEFETPLANYLKTFIADIKSETDSSKYTKESYDNLILVLSNAELVANNKDNSTKEEAKELIISLEIGKIKDAITALEKRKNADKVNVVSGSAVKITIKEKGDK